jgi:hypothetical protein
MWLWADSTARPLVFSIMIMKTWLKCGTEDGGAPSRAAGCGAETVSERLSSIPPPGPDGSGSPPGGVELSRKRTPTRMDAVPGGTVPAAERRSSPVPLCRSGRLTVRRVTGGPAGWPEWPRKLRDTRT